MAAKPESRNRPARPFWRAKRLAEMTHAEWESLCDGCGKCCLLKLQDVETDNIVYTDVACRLLDLDTCRCGDYANRKRRVPDCVQLTPETLPEAARWLPATCAYRRLYEGKDLLWWHPLVSGRRDTVHHAGASARHRAIHETSVRERDLERRIVSWVSR